MDKSGHKAKPIAKSESINAIVFVSGMVVMLFSMLATMVMLPDILRVNDIGIASVQLVNTIPVALIAIMYPIGSAWLRLGSVRRMYQISLLIFLVGTVLTLASKAFAWIFVGKIIQAVSFGLFFPIVIPLVRVLLPNNYQGYVGIGRKIVISVTFGLSIIIPGILVSVADWRFVYYLVLALAVLALVTSIWLTTELEVHKLNLDWYSILLSIGFLGFVWSVGSSLVKAVPLEVKTLVFIGSLLLIIGYIIYNQYVLKQKSSLRVFLNVKFSVLTFNSAVAAMSMMAVLTIGVLYLEQGLHYSVFLTSLSLIPSVAVFFGGVFFGTKLSNKLKISRLTKNKIGSAILATGWLIMAIFASSLNLVAFIVISSLIELGHGILAIANRKEVLHKQKGATRRKNRQTFDQCTFYLASLGVTVLTVLLQQITESEVGGTLPGTLASLSGYRAVFFIIFVITIFNWAITMMLGHPLTFIETLRSKNHPNK